MSDRAGFASSYEETPYWWQGREAAGEDEATLPSQTDVLIVGSGYTGLHAAIETTQAGLGTVVIDAEQIGWGCSTRNGGQISTSVKPGYDVLSKRYGTRVAEDILREGQASLDFTAGFIECNEIKCDFEVTGRFHGAHSPRQYDKLAKACAAPNPVLQTDAYMVSKMEQHTELGTEFYHGGVVYPKHASVNPGRYHAGLVRLAKKGGASLVPHCTAQNIAEKSGAYELSTTKGVIRAKKLVIATNGYSGRLLPWLQRRIIPIGSYIIATEDLPKEVTDRLFPTNRILSDTRKLVYYYRLSPDRKRVLFGGRVSLRETDPRKSAPILHRDLVRIFPELRNFRIAYSWQGTVGYTFDTLAHAGRQGDMYWAGGYCGSGVGMASYLGNMIGRQVCGDASARTVFSEIPFRGRPYFRGNPWFLSPSILYYRMVDAIG